MKLKKSGAKTKKMNKIILTMDDAVFLFNWRDRNKEKVRHFVSELREGHCPLSECEIIVEDSKKKPKFKVKAFTAKFSEEIHYAQIYINIDGISYGSKTIIPMADGMYKCIANSGKKIDELSSDDIVSFISLWCTTMALLMNPESLPTKENKDKKPQSSKTVAKTSQKPKKKTSSSVTYILHRQGNSPSLTPRGKRTLSGKEFSVRGHFRHYKNGKVIWIPEYTKGDGKKKNKIYKLGGK